MSSTSNLPESEDTVDPVVTESPAPEAVPASVHPDPITGEPGAHPVGVGVGALGAGVAGAAIGAIGGPVGILIGAAIGALAGGLAGKEVAMTSEEAELNSGNAAMEDPVSTVPADMPTPISMASIPGEGFRAMSGAGFAGDAGMLATETAPETMENRTSAAPTYTDTFAPGLVEDDALPTPTHAAVADGAGFQAPAVLEAAPLVGASMPSSGEEAVRAAAYYLYLDRTKTGQPGDELGDWLAAEREMMLS